MCGGNVCVGGRGGGCSSKCVVAMFVWVGETVYVNFYVW
jgi:hypothetical protein